MVKRLHSFFILLLFTASTGYCQITFNGNMTEGYWGIPLGTSAGGAVSCSGAGNSLNSLYAAANDNEIQLGIGADVQDGHHILVFIDSKPGGYSNGSFGRSGGPSGLKNFNSNTSFDAGFLPDYCLVIGTNVTHDQFSFELYTLSGSVAFGGGPNINMGNCTVLNPVTSGLYKLSCSPSTSDFTQGFELGLPKTVLGYDPGNQQIVKLMAMSITDAGSLNNQFLSKANIGEGCYGTGPINFAVASPNYVEYNPSQSLPIDFVNVYVRQVGQVIKTVWKSASEKEMKEYLVERSEDAITFTTIGTVAAKGTSTVSVDYEFADVQPIVGKNFYRVKAVDKSGRSTYSIIVKINYGRVDNSLTIFPNPVKDQINLQIVAVKPGTYDLEIFNDAGQKMISEKIVYNGGYGLQQIPLLPNMMKGPYRLLLRNKSVFYKQNFLVQ
ncbi:MAG: hypothetical protein ABIX01_17380 [Chitinophagaceae bacterium]